MICSVQAAGLRVSETCGDEVLEISDKRWCRRCCWRDWRQLHASNVCFPAAARRRFSKCWL